MMRRPGSRHVLSLIVGLAACGPGKDTSGTETSGGSSSGSSSGSSTDGPTTTPTSSTGAPLGCIGADAAACAASTPENGDNVCQWVDVYTAAVAGTVCRTELARSVCMETNGNEGGPGCSGFYKTEQEGVELLVGTGCGDPLSEPGWGLCFVDGVTPAVPECACIGEGYCADQADEATCVLATHDLRACAWQPGGCGTA